ncbi:DNA phosphorothioation-associated putative methyltransferase [Motilimonas cestriensis]|uniref:DNA phosphorothioation-associated putative methyltransferase n=1 Tax=Motilimonas cestriensis TaxID=2742685 RepID=UPI003DA522AB
MLNATEFKQLVKQAPYKKVLPDAIYLHKSALEHAPEKLVKFIYAVANALKINEQEWDLVKLAKNAFRLSLLHYPDFFTESYPALKTAITIDLEKLSHRVTQYQQQDNPPILHRKETMISPDHECYATFKSITEEGERAGLYEQPRLIGFQQTWLRLIEKKGYTLIDGRLFRNTAAQKQEKPTGIEREKTAIVRHELSAPMKQLAKHGYLSGEYTVFDYGCGRGDDLRELEAHGIDALGWDPNFRPEDEKINSDIVNLGFVINVIEDQDERIAALINAWELTEKLLVVSAMLGNERTISQFKPYKDGVITSRNTFQKYYDQSELKHYLERVVDEVPITIAPGIFYLFKDKIEEQRFLAQRQRRHHQWQQLTAPTPTNEAQARLLITTNLPLFEDYWRHCLQLGRTPAATEFSQNDQLKHLAGSPRKAFKLAESYFDANEFQQAQALKREDLLVYFALSQFDKRKTYVSLPDELKRDVKYFFTQYQQAQEEAKALLFSISNKELIEQACIAAHKILPASVLNQGHSLILHKQWLVMLPAILRVYVGAAAQLYGELEPIDLVKIHITSGKVSFMIYDDFENSSVPFLVERIKVKMMEQDIDFFDYVDPIRQPPLLCKGNYLTPEHHLYLKQSRFDKRLAKLLQISTDIDTIMPRIEYEQLLNKHFKKVKNYSLICISSDKI